MDRNKNGRLDLEELNRFAIRKPDAEMIIDIGKRSSITRFTGTSKGKRSTAHQPLPGIVIKHQTEVSFPTAKIRFRVLRSQYLNHFYRFPKRMFQQLDRDKNGYMDSMEVQGTAHYNGMFSSIDFNNDGFVSLKEHMTFWTTWRRLFHEAQNASVSLSLFDAYNGLFGALDIDQDKHLSLREMHNASRVLMKYDHNKDGYLTRDEFPKQYHFAIMPGMVRYAQNAMPLPTLRYQKKAPTWFREMDRNKDGDVSFREFLSDAKRFRKLDKDGDGLLSVTEALAVKKGNR